MKTLLFIYNQHAGRGAVAGHMAEILNVFAKAGYLVTVYPTRGKADATRAAAMLGQGYDRVVCAGGDGTLNEVITGLLEGKTRPVLGYIPTGTTNDFSRNLYLPRGMERQAAVAAGGVPRMCDIGYFNGKPFIYVAAFGAFTEVSYGTAQEFKQTFGHLAYVLEGVGRLSKIKGYTLRAEHDGGTLQGDFIYGMMSNTVSVGGFKGLPEKEVKLDDGLFECVFIRQPHSAADLQAILRSLTGRRPTPDGPVIAFRTAHLTVTSPKELSWSLDGEFGGTVQQAELQTHRHAVTIACGR